jgi:hypothetical protein
MSEPNNNNKEIMCPWCHNSLDIIQSSKTGLHYANCGSCNAHFRNIPLALLGLKDNDALAHNGADTAPVSSAKDNTQPLSNKEKSLAERRKGIPPSLWKYLSDDEDANHDK